MTKPVRPHDDISENAKRFIKSKTPANGKPQNARTYIKKTALRGKMHPSFCERSKNDGVCKTIQFFVEFLSVWESNSCIPVANSSIWGANPSVRVTNRLASATSWAISSVISSVISSFCAVLPSGLTLGRVTRYIYQKYPRTGMSNTNI